MSTLRERIRDQRTLDEVIFPQAIADMNHAEQWAELHECTLTLAGNVWHTTSQMEEIQARKQALQDSISEYNKQRRPDHIIICRLTREKSPFVRGVTVLKRTETNPAHTGFITSICDSGYVTVRWHNGQISNVHRDKLVLQANWKTLRDELASLKNYWQPAQEGTL